MFLLTSFSLLLSLFRLELLAVSLAMGTTDIWCTGMLAVLRTAGYLAAFSPPKDNRLTPSWGSAWKQRIRPAPELVRTLLQTHAWNQVKYPDWDLRLQLQQRNIRRAGRHIPKKAEANLSRSTCVICDRERGRDRQKNSFKFYSTWELHWCFSLWMCACVC